MDEDLLDLRDERPPASDGQDLLDEFLSRARSELSQDEATRVYELMAKVLANIIQNPTEAKFRSVKKASKAVSATRLGSCQAAVSLLLLAGFEDRDEAFVFPEDVEFAVAQALLEKLQSALFVGQMSQLSFGGTMGTSSSSCPGSAPVSPAAESGASKPTRPVPEYQAPASGKKPVSSAFKFQASRNAAANASKVQDNAAQSLAEIRQQKRQTYQASGGAAAISSSVASSACAGPDEAGAAPAADANGGIRGILAGIPVPSWLPGVSGDTITPQSGDARTMRF